MQFTARQAHLFRGEHQSQHTHSQVLSRKVRLPQHPLQLQ